MNESLKIVHCANFSNFKNGASYYAMDRKITHGLIQNGHFVYDFSYRDVAKENRRFGIKSMGLKKMNKNLIKLCDNLMPDLLLLSKAEMIDPQTLKQIKEVNPKIKIAKWFVDIVETQNDSFYEQFNHIDFFFQTAGSRLEKLSKRFKDITCAYLPSITDSAFDKSTSQEKKYDIIYIARDHKEDVRYKFAVELDKFCKKNNLKLKLCGSLGNPPVFGHNYYDEISKSKIAINFNRDEYLDKKNENKIMESSDRMNHFLGVGTCTFTPEINEMDKLFKDNQDIVYFIGMEDCFKKIKKYLNKNLYEKIGVTGSLRAYEVVNAKRVTKYMLEVIKNGLSEKYEWDDYIYNNGKKLQKEKNG